MPYLLFKSYFAIQNAFKSNLSFLLHYQLMTDGDRMKESATF